MSAQYTVEFASYFLVASFWKALLSKRMGIIEIRSKRGIWGFLRIAPLPLGYGGGFTDEVKGAGVYGEIFLRLGQVPNTCNARNEWLLLPGLLRQNCLIFRVA